MLALLSILACAGDTNTTTPAKPVFDGYHVKICVVSTYDMSLIGEDPMVTVLQAQGFDRLTELNQYVLTLDESEPKNHWCTKDITIFAEQDSQAIYSGVAPTRNTYTIDKVEVTYEAYMTGLDPVVYDFPGTNARRNTSHSATIEPKRDEMGWWRFNIVSATNNAIPTAIVDQFDRRR